ncbi:MAG: septal ring lytic transglycosylase RlpA family protein [Candidatus Sericytochromatia bacterium]
MLKQAISLPGLKPRRLLQFSVALLCLLGSFSGPTEAEARARLPVNVGLASYYSSRFHGKCCTANGEKVNIYSMTAAHRSLPFGSVVRVTNLSNSRSVVVRINDRGPYGGSRIIDLSQAAFKRIAKTQKGMVRVRLDLL